MNLIQSPSSRCAQSQPKLNGCFGNSFVTGKLMVVNFAASNHLGITSSILYVWRRRLIIELDGGQHAQAGRITMPNGMRGCAIKVLSF